MSYINESDFCFALDFLEFDLHFLTELKVKRAQRFIKKKDLGFVDKSSCDSNTLLLTAGKKVNVAAFISAHVNKIEHFKNSFPDFFIRNFFKAKSESDIFVNVQIRKKRVFLEYGVDFPFIWRKIIDSFSIKKNVPAFGIYKASDNTQSGCFTTAGRSQKCDEFVVADIEINMAKNTFSVKFNNNIL